MTINVTLTPFPIQWDTSLENFISRPDFDAILTALGRLWRDIALLSRRSSTTQEEILRANPSSCAMEEKTARHAVFRGSPAEVMYQHQHALA